MADQKRIISSQSSLLDDLSGHLNRSSPMLSDDIEEEEVSRGSPSMPRTPPGSSAPVLSGGPSNQQRSSRGSGVGGVSRSSVASMQTSNRRNLAPAGRGAPSVSQSVNSGSHTSLNARSQQREQLSQKLHSRAGANTSSTVQHPRAPRPNSAGGRGATPRARSWAERGGGSAPASSARGPSPTRSPDSTHSSQYSQHAVATAISKKPGGPLPPALPLLRPDA